MMEFDVFEKQRKVQWDILTRFDKYISDTHTKTSIVLTIQILIAGAAATNFSATILFLTESIGLCRMAAVFLPVYFIFTSIIIVWKCIAVVNPFLKSSSNPSEFFFIDVASMIPAEREIHFRNLDDKILTDLFEQVKYVATGLSNKMRNLQEIYTLIKYLQLIPVACAFLVIGVMA